MRLPQAPDFAGQRERYALRFTCEHCSLFDPDSGRCAHGFPTEDHRLARYEDVRASLVFCKDFDLM
jgi:hypothetical protein